MNDLVERLRKAPSDLRGVIAHRDAAHEAADEIERLNNQLVCAKSALMAIRKEMNHPENDSLAIVKVYALATETVQALD